MKLDDFISLPDQGHIVSAIAAAERATSGEIRVHVTPKCRGDVVKHAIKTFNRLKMYETRHRNGVLIFIAFESRKFAILGDVGINDVVPTGYWNDEIEALAAHLKVGNTAQGLCQVIASVGEKLKAFFPAEPDDENELSNDISFEE